MLFRKRDGLLLVVAVWGMLSARQIQTVRFSPSLYYVVERPHGPRAGAGAGPDDAPPPVRSLAVDADGDGAAELLVAGGGVLRLFRISAPAGGDAGDGAAAGDEGPRGTAQVTVLAEADIARMDRGAGRGASLRVGGSKDAAALAFGTVGGQARFAVLRDDLSVVLTDASLGVLWTSSLREAMVGAEARGLGILDASLHVEDGAGVLVSVSLGFDAAAEAAGFGLEASRDADGRDAAADGTAGGAGAPPAPLCVALLDGATGAVVWTHGGAVPPAPSENSNGKLARRVLPAHQYRAGALAAPSPEREAVPFHRFRAAFLDALPQLYEHALDASVALIAVENRPKSRRADAAPRGRPAGGRPRNLVLCRSARGLEVLSLRSGAQVSSLRLQRHTLYVDLNGDRTIDAVAVRPPRRRRRGSHWLQDEQRVGDGGLTLGDPDGAAAGRAPAARAPCLAARSGLPARETLFATEEPCHLVGGGPRRGSTPDLAAPVAVPRDAGGAIAPAGQGAARAARYGVATLASDGVYTLVGGDGAVAAQARLGVSWDEAARGGWLELLRDGGGEGGASFLLAAGDRAWEAFGADGEAVCRGEMLQPALVRPRMADIDGDGVGDLLFEGRDVLWAVRMRPVPPSWAPVLPFLLLLVVCAATFAAGVQVHREEEGARRGGRRPKPLAYVRRSTDD